jgi:hypothetical protein
MKAWGINTYFMAPLPTRKEQTNSPVIIEEVLGQVQGPPTSLSCRKAMLLFIYWFSFTVPLSTNSIRYNASSEGKRETS